ncbi:MAG: hypothetical protein A3I66_20405 [Burkholderiales bacterium RIFCSPLOWO2_02_FULL_57_36]|nr:MAG: hypothetical protein A3I66_20405 [Burkholderiales bacterium RIFCSPLOWO2_02_FULL_57_36]
MRKISCPRCGAGGVRQRGISLIMVMLIMVLVVLTSLGASRSSFFNETVTGNEADYNRAYMAAEALVQDAQLDINGQSAPGVVCINGCRPSGTPSLAQPTFPENTTEHDQLKAALAAAQCAQGICAPSVWPTNALPDNFWMTPATLAINTARAATYGQFTGAVPAANGNPILTANPSAGWYWVEVILFNASGCAAGTGACPPINRPFVYRITAVAKGKGNTIAVIQTFFTSN